jgi:hypothetical protein
VLGLAAVLLCAFPLLLFSPALFSFPSLLPSVSHTNERGEEEEWKEKKEDWGFNVVFFRNKNLNNQN